MSGERLNVLAVDDEPSPLEDLARQLRSFPMVEQVECAYDGHDALVKIASQRYEVIFLDVRMPDIDGLELGRVLRRFVSPPALVFVSAYDGAAADAFELQALDYLRKPVSRTRLEDALGRVSAALGAAPVDVPESPPAAAGTNRVAVANLRTGSTRLLAKSSILYVESNGDFVRIVSEDGRYLLRTTLAEIERRWESAGFVRVHRQYVANLRRAVELRPQLGGTAELVFACGQKIPIARRHVAELGRRLGV